MQGVLGCAQHGIETETTRVLYDDLWAIQREFGYLPQAKLNELAARRSVPLHRVHEVASFYPVFHLEPQPQIAVGVCANLARHMRGADALCSRLQQRFSFPELVEEMSFPGQCDGARAILSMTECSQA